MLVLDVVAETSTEINTAEDANTTTNTFEEYIDEKQKNISDKVIEWSENIDDKFSSWASSDENNNSGDEKEAKINERFLSAEENRIDLFFQSEKFIDETEKRFVRLRLGTLVQSKDSSTMHYRVGVQIPLSQTKKRFKLFIDNIEEDYFRDATAPIAAETIKDPSIGISYFSPEYEGVKSKYSIGIGGSHPYIRARYSKVFNADKYKIEPTQQFKHSTKYDFSEESNIYFDRAIREFSLFRMTLHRKTQAHVKGMDYSVAFAYYYTTSKKTGLSLSQSFWGNTKYKYILNSSTNPVTYSREYGGISDYVTALSWRKSVWRKWFAYEVQPAISFHRQYDYKANYMLRINFDFYFGAF